MRNLHGEVALVTGAGSGIGRATALMLGTEGCRVAVTDIDAEAASATADEIAGAGGTASSWAYDVTDPDRAVALADEVSTSLGTVSILVNNAGIAVAGFFVDTSRESFDRVVSINLMGVVHGCRAFLPAMVESGRPGHVVNIASVLGQIGMRGVSAYCMSKFGVVGFSESLRAEMSSHGIGVSTICPGMIRTSIIDNGTLESSDPDLDRKRETIESLFQRRNFPPERVARAVVKSIRKNKGVVPVAPEAWFAYYLKRWAPWLSYRLLRRIG